MNNHRCHEITIIKITNQFEIITIKHVIKHKT